DDCLHIWRGSYNSREKEVYMKWWAVADHIFGMILLDKWLEPYEPVLPSEETQVNIIDTKRSEKETTLSLPQAAVDYVISGGYEDFKCSIFEMYSEGKSTDDIANAIKEAYGIGGSSDAIPGSGYSQWHDGKGLMISKSYRGEDKYSSVLLTWNKVAKRITELIEANRYLTAEEKEYYPAYIRKKEIRRERQKIADEYTSIILSAMFS
ncbi:MAG: hypothetical protein KBT46_00600, partial [Ruminococcus sp.]|nr:hypothetical protein [Candidatus Copronaster equi]